MTRTLFIGDLHAKPDLLPLISHVADREHAHRIILLGDICDDWHASNRSMVEFVTRFSAWYRRQAEHRDVIPLLGNHDMPYWMRHDSTAYWNVRRVAMGFKPGAYRHVHELMRLMPFRFAWTDGPVLATHAGLTRTWCMKRWGSGYASMNATAIADRLNRMLGHSSTMASPMLDVGPARGGDRTPSFLWCDRTEFAMDGDTRLTQVVGHTPVRTVTHEHDAWFCDTFSTMSDDTPIGDRSLLIMDDGPEFHVTSLLG